MARTTGRERRKQKGQGIKGHGKNPVVSAGDWACWSRPARGVVDVRAVVAGRGRKVPLDSITPGADRDLSVDQRW